MRFLHTMLRTIDLEKSIEFYTNILGMKLLDKIENEDYKYTLAFLGFSKDDCQIELTYNWGENNYNHGTAYGHIALEVDDLYEICDIIRNKGITISREPGPVLGGTAEIAFIKDPDNYSIELIQKGTLNIS